MTTESIVNTVQQHCLVWIFLDTWDMRHANNNVFIRRLKAVSVSFRLRTGSGRLFQWDWPAMAKARQPYVSSRWRGRCSRFRSAERRCLWLDSGTQWTARYWGSDRSSIYGPWPPAWTLRDLWRQTIGASHGAASSVRDQTCSCRWWRARQHRALNNPITLFAPMTDECLFSSTKNWLISMSLIYNNYCNVKRYRNGSSKY